jgi:cob(I)alamin adenosyltransferase
MKIYTRTGDKGETSLLGGTRVAKHDLRIEAYGTVDELNAWVGLLMDKAGEHLNLPLLLNIQENLFVIGSQLAMEKDDLPFEVPSLSSDSEKILELEMDKMDEELTALKNFILPGGHECVSYAHLARTVCRRAERRVTALWHEENKGEDAIVYLNRLSDFFFTLSRFLSHRLKVDEKPWKP